ncbi:AGR321Wp [Eremothecium gossypii ATCC 10895]|uniref:AGR321Wp n=1 Tax=Eremothecium gossypii (strain ATCC 10895 / CBS 109.51 / FGSC 9923 / NRRL Y-1056) TaxID=284811 RepID=Q74ZF7_EREGS|nr:AGR321Wp [Eremothecium gossypii ATCC 10895]AAS54811.2 AGR321Wp [Eremothecium gossypii ATCC 10895]
MSIRPATHAGSWYLSNPTRLSQQLSKFLNDATTEHGGVQRGTRAIISPHAGYSYCGETMAKCYAKLDVNKDTKRVFVLGPSHHFHFRNIALVSRYTALETPLGNLQVDEETVSKLLGHARLFRPLDYDDDQKEHSLEMQYPMLHETLLQRGVRPSDVKIVPILISYNSTEVDYAIGKILIEYLQCDDTAVIVSSDFCHWGRRFGYTGYVSSVEDIQDAVADGTEIETLTTRSKMDHHSIQIYKSIELLDRYAMDILGQMADSREKYQIWKDYLEVTGNTICGEKPIGVLLCAFSYVNTPLSFHWCGYSQSSEVKSLEDSSVSYAAGYCIF